jgi:TolB protein
VRHLEPAWSADGRHLLYVSDQYNRNFEIYRINTDGSDVLRLTQQPAWDSSPVWVSGGRIVFESQRDGSPDLYIMDGDGTHIRRLTFGNARDREPS